ncbi:terpene synthase family protein [Streptomyces lavendofoliae]|uniref:terpene synthase family protein n=1 Tax=Streptomyces lavendofoliae TaxID=67314 RepID=UPI003D8E0C94
MNCSKFPTAAPLTARAGLAERLQSWAQYVRLVNTRAEQQRLSAMRLDVLATYIAPWADVADAELTAQWAAFICLIDDRFDRCTPDERSRSVDMLFDPVMAVLAGETVASSAGPQRAMADLWGRTASRMPEPWRKRFIADYADYARATREESDSRARERQLSLAEYLTLRRRTITLLPMADVMECTSSALMPNPPGLLEELRYMAADVVGWANDLASVEEDGLRGHANLVTVLQYERSCSRTAARDEARRMHERRLREFRSLARRIEQEDGACAAQREAVHAYTAAFCRLVDAALHWLGMTGRFDPHGSPAVSLSDRAEATGPRRER